MDFTDNLNLDLTENHKLAFKIALDKLGATIEKPVNITTWMFLYATNYQDKENPNTLFFKDRVTRKTFKIPYGLYDIAEVVN
tara:strand:- start:327 stop:572 length:246 start_codon:yes stop_codon:yes gene_type:complete